MSYRRKCENDTKVNYEANQPHQFKESIFVPKSVLFLFAFLFLLPTTIGFAQTSYELVCRGGGTLYFNYTPFSNFWSQPQIWIDNISKGSRGVGNSLEAISSLQPGQCAWKDRPIHANEPSRIIIPVNYNNFSISWHQGKVMGISSTLSYINNLQDPNRYQSFHVYNDRRGNFISTKIGSMQ